MNYKTPGFEIESGYGGAIAMLLLPEDVAEEITKWSNGHISDAEIYGKDGKGRGGSPHVTLQNGIMCEDADELEKLFSQLPGMEAEFGSIGVFSQDDKDYDVVHIQVVCPDLHAANTLISDLLEVNNPYMDYHPHVTLGYVNKGAGKRFNGRNDFAGKKVDLSRLMVDGPGIKPRTLDLKKREDHLEGGKADDMNYDDFDPGALKKGTDHELEHTKNIEIAREIAMDHLAEDPDYYEKLDKVEAEKNRCSHSKKGWCGRCKSEPLKDSLDYGSRKAARYTDYSEECLLDSDGSENILNHNDLRRLVRGLRKEL